MSENKTPTIQEIEDYCNKLTERLKKQDPQFDLKAEFGLLLMRHIDSFTPAERARYDELKKILK